ncbi:hypothetical protein [Viridibacillus arvi]|uniref:hypothetical protein n=1 Tax=Viridibacillus arvi TaxID=263475 RepID=UPI003D2BD8C8
MNQLYISLNEAGLMFKVQTNHGEVGFILLETNDSGTTQSVDVYTFETLLEDVKGSSSYEALSGSHTLQSVRVAKLPKSK